MIQPQPVIKLEFIVINDNNIVQGRFNSEANAFDWALCLQDRYGETYSIEQRPR